MTSRATPRQPTISPRSSKHPDWMQVHNQRGLASLIRAAPILRLQISQRQFNWILMPQTCTSTGRAYLELNRLKQARADLDRAIDLQPAFTSAYENRARLFDQTHDF